MLTGNTKDVFLIYGIVVTELFSLYTISFHFVKLSLAFSFFFYQEMTQSYDIQVRCTKGCLVYLLHILCHDNTKDNCFKKHFICGKKLYLGKIILKAIFQIYKTINMFCLKDNFISKIFDLISYLIWDMRIFAKLHSNDWKYQLLQ